MAPWRLALITILQFAEKLPDRQAADAVRARLEWKYALGLELEDQGVDFSVLSEFRSRLIAGNAEYLLFDTLLDHAQATRSGQSGWQTTHGCNPRLGQSPCLQSRAVCW